MLVKNVALALFSTVAIVEAGHYHRASWGLERRQNRGKGKGGGGGNAGNGGGGNPLCLNADAVQSASNEVGDLSDPTRKASATDPANFINFCSGKPTTNGLQVEGGSCNGVVMGEIPAKARMPSVLITNPPNGGNIAPDTTFDVDVTVRNFAPGTFTNPDETYYSAPQTLNGGGQIIGHTHVTCQDVGNANQVPPADTFVFFKGINDVGDGNNNLKATVTDGLKAGSYRCCTMTSAANHQPAVMPVAQRGSMDDCVRFTVGGGGRGNQGKKNNNAAAGNQGNNGNQDAAAGNGKNNGKKNVGKAAGKNAGKAAGKKNLGGGKKNLGGKKALGKKNLGGFRPPGAASAASTATPEAPAADAGADVGAGADAGAGVNANQAGAGALGGIAAPAVTNSGNQARPFKVNNDTFVNEAAAKQRACAIQNNACANAVNGGQLQGVTVGQCNEQEGRCRG